MQDVDGPSHIQPLPEPAGTPRPRVDAEALRVVTGTESLDGIFGDGGRRRYLRERTAIRPPELECPVG